MLSWHGAVPHGGGPEVCGDSGSCSGPGGSCGDSPGTRAGTSWGGPLVPSEERPGSTSPFSPQAPFPGSPPAPSHAPLEAEGARWLHALCHTFLCHTRPWHHSAMGSYPSKYPANLGWLSALPSRSQQAGNRSGTLLLLSDVMGLCNFFFQRQPRVGSQARAFVPCGGGGQCWPQGAPRGSCGHSTGMWHTMAPRGGVWHPCDRHHRSELGALFLLRG